MGGRGSAGGVAAVSAPKKAGGIESLLENMKSLDNYGSEKLQKEDLSKKLPTYGDKVQSSYIDYVKKQTGIDLTPVRDTYFDNRKGFNIDTSKLKYCIALSMTTSLHGTGIDLMSISRCYQSLRRCVRRTSPHIRTCRLRCRYITITANIGLLPIGNCMG